MSVGEGRRERKRERWRKEGEADIECRLLTLLNSAAANDTPSGNSKAKQVACEKWKENKGESWKI